MTTTRRTLIASALATAVVPTLALAAVAGTAPHPIFAAMETYRAAWHRLDDACTKVDVLIKSPHTTTVAALKAAEAERDAIGEHEERHAYEKLFEIAVAGMPMEAVTPFLAQLHEFDLDEYMDFHDLRKLLSSIGAAAAKA